VQNALLLEKNDILERQLLEDVKTWGWNAHAFI